MLITSWYYDERDQMFKKTSLEEWQCQLSYEKLSDKKKAQMNLENCRYVSLR